MSRDTGRPMDAVEHLRQSILDILLTPIGSRVHRRDYGSMLPRLVDRPMNPQFVSDLIEATATALARWEPRIRVERITIVAGTAGQIKLGLYAFRVVDNTPLQINDLVIA
ncbi:MAG: GPW/gp25 family protein [Cyanobacteria bacterium J06638_7]